MMELVSKILPSPRAQWSAFFAAIWIIVYMESYASVYGIGGGFVGAFLLFYFPLYWLYSFDFLAYIRNIGASGDTVE